MLIYKRLLWHSYQKALQDEQNWWKFWGPLLSKWIVVGGATLIWDGPGFYVASIATAAVGTIYDAVQDTRSVEHDGKMVDQSLRFFEGRVSGAYSEIALNTVNALNLIRAGDPPQIPTANVTVSAMKSFGHYRLWPGLWWAEQASQLELNIDKNNTLLTTFLTSAAYDHSRFWTGTERLLPEGESLELTGNTQDIAAIKFKTEEWGESPDENSSIDLLVLGATETGLYPIASFQTNWNPTRIEQSSLKPALAPAGYTAAQAAQALTLPYPLSSVVASPAGSADYQLTITVLNPFSISVAANVTQTLPADFVILDPGDAQVVDNALTWQSTLEPESGLEFHALLGWTGLPGQVATVSGAELAFRDPATGMGDTYATTAETVAAAWPLIVTSDMPVVWQIDTTVNVPITATNITSATVSGVFSSTLTTVDGQSLWSETRPIGIAPGASLSLSFALPTPRMIGYAVLTGEVSLGPVRRRVLHEVVEIPGLRTYLPLALR